MLEMLLRAHQAWERWNMAARAPIPVVGPAIIVGERCANGCANWSNAIARGGYQKAVRVIYGYF